MVYTDKTTAIKNILIQKIVCSSSLSSDMLENLSIAELNNKLNKMYPSVHPHNGCGSLKWKNVR